MTTTHTTFILVGIFGRHIGRHGVDGVHGRFGVGQRNLEGRMLLEFCLEINYVCHIHGIREMNRRR